MKKEIIVFTLFFAIITYSQAYMKIEKFSGGTDSIALSNIQRIYFQTMNTIDTAGLVAYFPFTDSSANDFSGHGNHGIKNNVTPVVDRFNRENGAFSFNGTSSYLNMGNSSSLQNFSSLTISLWIRFGKGGSGSPRLISKGYGNGMELYMVGTDSINTVGVQAASPSFHSNTKLRNGVWYHIAFKCDGVNSTFYINGIKDTSKIFTSIFSNSKNLIIGRSTNLNSVDNYNGSIDDIFIYNRMLTDAEITRLYQVGN